METKKALIRSTETTQTIISALHVVGWLSIVAGIIMGLQVLSYSVMAAVHWLLVGICSAIGVFALGALLNHLRQIVLLQAGERPADE